MQDAKYREMAGEKPSRNLSSICLIFYKAKTALKK